MERGDPTLYYGTKQSHFGLVNFKFIRGVVTTPLVNHVTKKGLIGRGLRGILLNICIFYMTDRKCHEPKKSVISY